MRGTFRVARDYMPNKREVDDAEKARRALSPKLGEELIAYRLAHHLDLWTGEELSNEDAWGWLEQHIQTHVLKRDRE